MATKKKTKKVPVMGRKKKATKVGSTHNPSTEDVEEIVDIQQRLARLKLELGGAYASILEAQTKHDEVADALVTSIKETSKELGDKIMSVARKDLDVEKQAWQFDMNSNTFKRVR